MEQQVQTVPYIRTVLIDKRKQAATVEQDDMCLRRGKHT